MCNKQILHTPIRLSIWVISYKPLLSCFFKEIETNLHKQKRSHFQNYQFSENEHWKRHVNLWTLHINLWHLQRDSTKCLIPTHIYIAPFSRLSARVLFTQHPTKPTSSSVQPNAIWHINKCITDSHKSHNWVYADKSRQLSYYERCCSHTYFALLFWGYFLNRNNTDVFTPIMAKIICFWSIFLIFCAKTLMTPIFLSIVNILTVAVGIIWMLL